MGPLARWPVCRLGPFANLRYSVLGIWYSVVGEPSIISESVLNNEYPVREYPSSLPVANVIYRLLVVSMSNPQAASLVISPASRNVTRCSYFLPAFSFELSAFNFSKLSPFSFELSAHPVSRISHPVSSIQYPASSIQHAPTPVRSPCH